MCLDEWHLVQRPDAEIGNAAGASPLGQQGWERGCGSRLAALGK